MKIRVIFFIPNKKEFGTKPEEYEYKGNFAIETMLIKTAEKFFGLKTANAIEDLLKTRNGDE